MNNYKIKLPRKRKKAYIKKYGYGEYYATKIVSTLLYKRDPIKKNTRFPEFKIERRKLIVLFNW